MQHSIKFFEISPDGKFIVINSIKKKNLKDLGLGSIHPLNTLNFEYHHQEPIVKKDPKARKEPIKPTNVSPVTIPTVPQETISTISRRSSISSIESINLQDYPPLQERRERLIEKLHN
ncbi:unnamed protein product [Rhizophagus irregularis]|uniref:Uncharacterized protein n=1 Tax=Rhizophagus irregularis TaxID=588596 RepID=A0A915ZZ06_9GLOM|nr:unnamed protein product [Rhizophagus irregularis]CAB5396002.1 unnamed protein product [Rhizophagus irregularis]